MHYYVLSPFVHVQKNPAAKKALGVAIKFASEVANRSGLSVGAVPDAEMNVRVYLALWLLGNLHLSPFYGELAVQLDRSWK